MRLVLAGGSYGFALPDRTFGALMPDHITTSAERVELPGEAVLGLVGTRFNGRLFMSGQGHASGFAWVWDGAWRHLVQTALSKGETFGVSPCAFGDRALFVATSGYSYLRLDLETGERTEHLMDVGTQGIRYVDGETPVPGDATLRDGELFEYTRRGDVTIGQGHYGGCLANGRVLEPGDCRFIRFEREQDELAVALWNQPGHSTIFHWLSRAEVDALPAPATAEPIVRVGRPMWCGFFAGGPNAPGTWRTSTKPQSLPGNCYLDVTTGLLCRMSDGLAVAQYVASEGAGPAQDVINLNAAIKAARTVRPDLLVLAYWTRQAQAGPPPVGADYVAIEAYWELGDTLDVMERKLRIAIAKCPLSVILGQVFTSNPGLSSSIALLVPVYARVSLDCLSVMGFIGFNGSGRPSGLQDHPDVLPLYVEFAAGVPSAPPVIVPSKPVPIPPKPAPAPKPPKPLKPTPPSVNPYIGDLLMLSTFSDPNKKLLVIKSVKKISGEVCVLENLDGRTVSIQPDGSVQDRDAGADGGYEKCRVQGSVATFKPVDEKFFTFAFVIGDGL